VQGVGFRWFVRQAARRLDVGGAVWNRTDGTVEIVAVGSDAALEELRQLVLRGPAGSRVLGLERLPPGDEVDFEGFEIQRD
jgi:acylphosphatase